MAKITETDNIMAKITETNGQDSKIGQDSKTIIL